MSKMSKKMWNKIFKSKTNKNSKTLQAANKINKRGSIYEEYQQLNAALDIVPITEKFNDNSNAPTFAAALNDTDKNTPPTTIKIPQAATTTFSKVVNTLTLKRSLNSNSNKDLKNATGNGNEGKGQTSKKSELDIKAKATTSLSDKTVNQSKTGSDCNISSNSISNSSTLIYDDHCTNSNCNFSKPYNASLNQQQQQKLTENEAPTANAASFSLRLNNNNNNNNNIINNNNNNNEYLACKQNLTNPPSPLLQQQKRLSKIVIVVKKLDASTPAATIATTATSITASELATNLNNQLFHIDRTNNSSTNNHFNNNNGSLKTNSSTALETSFALTPPATPSSSSEIIAANQSSLNLTNEIDSSDHFCALSPKDVNDHHYHQHSEHRKLYSNTFDNGNNITTPTEVPETNASLKLAPCPICSRTFNPATLRKHVGICEKMATKKRNKFDSSRQRREGTELASYPLPKNFGLPEKTTSTTAIAPARNERGQSPKPAVQQVSSPVLTRKKPTEDLIRTTARASMRKALAANTKNTTPPVIVTNSTPTSNLKRDRMRSSERSLTRRGIQPPPAEQCPHCERCFGIKAYDRHVEWCKEKALLATIKHGNSKNDGNVAKARLEARTKYRAPCVRTKRSLNREKYSGLAGEEQEIEDMSKCSKTSLNKTQEDNLMCMSMTSSMCSERKITNSTTGNINEPSAAAAVKMHKNISIGNRTRTRDKSQTQQPPTITAAAISQDIEENEEPEPLINLEFETQEFYLMGEQMTTATSINKKRRAKPTKTIADKVAAAKIKQQQQQQQPIEYEKDLQINSEKSCKKWKATTTDVQINLPSKSIPTIILEQKKSTSDLSLKSMRSNKSKAFHIDNDHHEDLNGHYDNVVSNNDEMKFEANEALVEENPNFSNRSTIYGSSRKNESNSRKILHETAVENNCKQMYSNNKMTMEEYFDKEEIYALDNHDFSTNLTSFHGKDSNESNDDDSIIGLNSNNFPIDKVKDRSSSQVSDDLSLIDPTDDQYQDFIMKQTYTNHRDDLTNDDDSEEIEESEIPAFKLDIPKSRTSNKRIGKPKLEKLETTKLRRCSSLDLEANISITTKCTSPKLLKSTKENSDSKESYGEPETYKDCLTDSDELRRRNITSQESLNTQENNNEEANAKELKEADLKNYPKTFRSSSKSDTFIRDQSGTPHKLLEFNDNYERGSQINCSKIIEDIGGVRTKVRSRSLTKPKEKNDKTLERNDTPRKSRLPSPQPQPQPPPPQSSTSSANTPNNQTSLPKSLKMCQPKRKKVLRQTASCTNTFPMKATMLALSIENLEICGVSSAPQIKTKVGKSEKGCIILGAEKGKEQIEYKEEKCGVFETVVEKDIAGVLDKEIKVIKEPPQLKRNRSFTVNGLPDNYDPFLSAKRQLEELCSPTNDSVDIATSPQTPQLPNMPVTPNSNNKMSTSLILSSSTPNTTPSPMTTSQLPQQTQKTPILARSFSFRRTSSLRGPRRSPMVTTRPPLFAQKHRPTIQRGLSDEGPISTNFLKPEEFDEMPVRSVCVNDFAFNKSPRVVRRDTSTSNRKQPLKLNINAANGNSSSATVSPNIMEPEVVNTNTTSKYVSKTDSLAVFLKFEHDLEKLNSAAADTDHKKENLLDVSSTITTSPSNLDGPLNAKELKEKCNNLSKQNSAKSIKADVLAANDETENYDKNLNTITQLCTNELATGKCGPVRLAPLATKPATPLTKPNTPQLTQQSTSTPQLLPLNSKSSLANNQEQKALKSPKPVALSSLFGGDNKNTTQSSLLYSERKSCTGSDYIDPKLINKCDNLPINLNLKRLDFKHGDSDASEARLEHFSSSSSESSASAKKAASQHVTKFLPTVKPQQPLQPQLEQQEQNGNLNLNINQLPLPVTTNSQRNSAEGRNLLKRRMRLGRNQFLYDASPEGDSCSADDEGANRSSMEGDASQQPYNSLRERERAFERLSSAQVNPIDAPFIPPLSAFDDFDFEEFLSSFENDEEQFPLFKDCREFLMNRTSKKQRSMLTPNSTAQNTNTYNNSLNFKKSTSPQTFPPLTPQSYANVEQHFQFPTLSQHPKNLFNSFSLNTRARNKFDELTATKSTDTFSVNSHVEDYKDLDSQSLNQKREIFISIETEQNDLDKSPISPNSIRHMVGNQQTVVEVEVDAAHDNKFSKISDDDADAGQHNCRSKNYSGNLAAEHLPNVQLNNAKNLMQTMQEEISGNLKLSMEHKTAPIDMNMNANLTLTGNMHNMRKINRVGGTPSGDAYGDSDELSSLDGYPLSSPNSRLGVSSKTSADSAYGSLSRQRSSELTCQRNSSRNRTINSNTANTLLNRPLTEETSLGRSRQLSASSSSSSEHALPPITSNSSYNKQQHLYNNQNNNNNNNIANNLDDLMRYELNNNSNNNNSNYDVQPTHSNLTGATNSHSNLESLQQYTSNSTMSTSMKMSKFCHECGSKFILEQAKFCMDCGVKRVVL